MNLKNNRLFDEDSDTDNETNSDISSDISEEFNINNSNDEMFELTIEQPKTTTKKEEKLRRKQMTCTICKNPNLEKYGLTRHCIMCHKLYTREMYIKRKNNGYCYYKKKSKKN